MPGKELTLVIDKEQAGIRAALLQNDQVVSFYFQSPANDIGAGELYLGRVSSSRISQAGWFISLGHGKSGFLPHHKSLAHNDLKTGDLRIVQIEKEARNGKVPELTEQIQIIGSGIIYLPFSGYTAVSHKISEDLRNSFRKRVSKWVQPPEGAIVRTLGGQMTVRQLFDEWNKLKRRWQCFEEKARKMREPGLIDRQLTFIGSILNENPAAESWTIYLNTPIERDGLPESVKWVYESAENLFALHDLDKVYHQAMNASVALPSGASLVIDYTEALTAIDVNSGSAALQKDWETQALEMNCQAASEIARQLRLREIGGMIIIDFLHLNDNQDKEQVLRQLEEAVKNDPSVVKLFGYTKLGLVEMTRKKRRYGLRDRVIESRKKR
ncbi:ribonuclease [Sporolactobacillus sp. THM7-4]|nr:ribonuclease [Sporolactobacillus sp. THM7-4]